MRSLASSGVINPRAQYSFSALISSPRIRSGTGNSSELSLGIGHRRWLNDHLLDAELVLVGRGGDLRGQAQRQNHQRFAAIGADDQDVPIDQPTVQLLEAVGAA